MKLPSKDRHQKRLEYHENPIFQEGILDSETILLQKPFSLEGLLGKVRAILDK